MLLFSSAAPTLVFVTAFEHVQYMQMWHFRSMLPVCYTAGDNFKTIHELQTSKSYSVHFKIELTRFALIRSTVRNILPFDIFYLAQSYVTGN